MPKPKTTTKKESKLKVSAVLDDDRFDGDDSGSDTPKQKPTASKPSIATRKDESDDDANDDVLKNVLGGDSDDEDDGNVLAKNSKKAGSEDDGNGDGEDEDVNAVKPLHVMEEAEIYKVQGSSDEYRYSFSVATPN